jgi:Xaa-Pro aminopeptidase
MDYVAQRRVALAKALKADAADAYLISNPVSVTYLTGFSGEGSYLVVTGKNVVLVTDTRFEGQVAEECPGLDVHVRGHDKTTTEAAAEVLAKTGVKTVGLEADHATLAFVEGLKGKTKGVTFAPVAGRVEALRASKDPGEVEEIRTAVRAAERAFAMFRATIRETDTEKDMVDALDAFIRRAGGRAASFPPIVAVGDRGALPHAPPTNRVLTDGSKLLVDWGVDIGYKSDLTRTFVSPFPTNQARKTKAERRRESFEELYAVVCEAQDAAAAAARPGVACKEVDAAARAVIEKAGFGKYFTHGTGHGIGLEIHEAPRIRANSDDVLDVGMVITLEPGIYLPKETDKNGRVVDAWGGVRVEDDFLITRDGASRLSTLPRTPDGIG